VERDRIRERRRRWWAALWVLLLSGWALGCSRLAVEPGVDPLPAGAKRVHAGAPLAAPPALAPSLWGHHGASGAWPVLTDPGDLPHVRVRGDPRERLPLEHTHVSARVVDFVAEVEVTQTYSNPHPEPIEVTYVFPLPENSAVHHLRMEIGLRVIEAEIREREAARREYEIARSAGHTAALLEQERPNVFTQSVANIAPGEQIDVVIRYMQDLTYDDGRYEFVFPMVVGPRHFAGEPVERTPVGSGTKRDTTRVPDASRISPPYLGEGQRSGHDISLELLVDSHLAITGWESPTHDIVTSQPADGTLRLRLADHETLPNRDFVLHYAVADMQPTARLYVSPEGEQGSFFSLVVVPPMLDVAELVGQREFVFVVDRSGSMTGVPLALARRVISAALAQLRPVDTFNVLSFSGVTQKAFEAPRPANRTNVLEAMKLVAELGAEGVTEMQSAVDLALSPEVEPGRHRYVFFLTDGEIGDEREVVARASAFVRAHHARGQRARVFGLGVGAAPNRHLVDTLSQAGGGIAMYASVKEDAPYAVNRFFHYVDRAVMTDVRVEWGSLVPRDVQPTELPDLFASHPVIVHGRFAGSPIAPGRVLGRVGDRDVELPIVLHPAPRGENRNAVLAALWARAKIGGLEQELAEGATDAQAAITRLGLDFHLVTPFTSLVAVDRTRRVGDGRPRRVVQPSERPADVNLDAAGGDEIDEDAFDQKRDDADYGYTFSDDPLTAGGFGPSDAAIRSEPFDDDEGLAEEPSGSTIRVRGRANRVTLAGGANDVPGPAAAAEELGEPPPPAPEPKPTAKPKPQSARRGKGFGPIRPSAKKGASSQAPTAPLACCGPTEPAPAVEPPDAPFRERRDDGDESAGEEKPEVMSAMGHGAPAQPAAAVVMGGDPPAPTEEAAEMGLGDICEIDPEACPQLDMRQEAAAELDEPIHAVQQIHGRRGCHCRLGNSAPSGAGWWTLCAVAALVTRRRGSVKASTVRERSGGGQ
jgi:Ca-activated chloride channel family protein